MKKNKENVKDPITIYKFDAMEHENLEDEVINLAPPKEAKKEMIFLIIAVVLKALQYFSLIIDGGPRIFIFSGLLLLSFGFLILSRVKKSKWDISKLVAVFFIMFLILDIAIIFLITK